MSSLSPPEIDLGTVDDDGGGDDANSHYGYGSAHHDAFELEVDVLRALLERNWRAHRRTKYYQRLSMALRFCVAVVRQPRQRQRRRTGNGDTESSYSASSFPQGYSFLQLWPEASVLLGELRTRADRERKKRKRREVFWEVSLACTADDGDGGELEKERRLYRDRLREFDPSVLLERFREALSRLEYASDALFPEIARGFFLPFCTVAVAAIARIRALLLRLASELAGSALPALRSAWNDNHFGGEVITTTTTTEAQRQQPKIWSDTQLVDLQSFVHGVRRNSLSAAAAFHRAPMTTSIQHTERALNCLGLALAKSRRGRSRSISGGNGGRDDNARDKDSTPGRRERRDHETATTNAAHHPVDDNDIGESIGFSISHNDSRLERPVVELHRDDAGPATAAVVVVDAAPSSRSAAAERRRQQQQQPTTQQAHHEFDKNEALVEQLRRRRKREKEFDEIKRKKKKRKKNGRGGGDFFDELFK